MSIFDSIKQRATGFRESLAAEVNKFRNNDFLNAIVASCVMVAAADGTISSDEKTKMLGFIQRSPELKDFDNSKIVSLFKTHADNIEFDVGMGQAEALKAISVFRSKPDAAKLIIRVCMAIANADGNFDADERKIVNRIISELGLNQQDFA